MNNEPEIWSDIHQDIINDAQGNLKKVINVNSVKTSIDNILKTYQGERVFLPTFASKLRDVLFDPIGEYLMSDMCRTIKDTIETWDDRVIVTGVDAKVDTDAHFIAITIKFQIRSYTEIFVHTTTVAG